MATIDLKMIRLCCDKTVHRGADEVIIYVLGICSDSSKNISRKFGPIDMNDGDQPTNNLAGDSHCITDDFQLIGGRLLSATIEPGEIWDIFFIVVELGGSSTAPAQEVLAGLLQRSGDPYATGAGFIIDIITNLGFVLTQSNVQIGSIGCHVEYKKDDGQIRSKFKEIDSAVFDKQYSEYHTQYRFNGGGSNYLGEFRLMPMPISLVNP